MTERIIRYVRLDEGKRSVPVYTGDPPVPLHPHWLAIAMTDSGQPSRHTYLLYLLTDHGEVLECLPFDAFEITLNQAKVIAGIPRANWETCNVLVPENGLVPWSLIVSSTGTALEK